MQIWHPAQNSKDVESTIMCFTPWTRDRSSPRQHCKAPLPQTDGAVVKWVNPAPAAPAAPPAAAAAAAAPSARPGQASHRPPLQGVFLLPRLWVHRRAGCCQRRLAFTSVLRTDVFTLWQSGPHQASPPPTLPGWVLTSWWCNGTWVFWQVSKIYLHRPTSLRPCFLSGLSFFSLSTTEKNNIVLFVYAPS